MKLGIMTCHDICNYGSSLQAYALSTWLTNEGHVVEIIDYKPEYMYRLVDFMCVDSEKWRGTFLRRWAYRVRVFPYKLSLVPKYIRYMSFNKRYLHLTKNRYRNIEDLKALRGFDAYICGSDQVWGSVKNRCGEDPAFFLGFDNQVKKIAYAASFGAAEISAKGAQCVKEYLPSFSAIGVREKSGVEILREHGLQSKQVIDPVFLLQKEDWVSLARAPKDLPEKYIFVYGYDSAVDMDLIAKRYARHHGWQVINAQKDLRYGPLEFLSIIQNAQLVLTSSFHAVAFSLIFEVPFLVVETKNTELFERITSILELTGMQDRKWHLDDEAKKIPDICFDLCRDQLAKEKTYSQHFLREALHD